jgi:serine protease AprX
VIAVALVAPALDTAWTSRAPLTSLVDPSLRAGEVALVHTTDGLADALSMKLADLGAVDIETDAAANTVVARLSPDALAALKTDTSVTVATSDTVIAASGGNDRGRRTGFESPRSGDSVDSYLRTSFSMTGPLPATGAGVTVAVMDTGIADHPDLQGRVSARVNFVKKGKGNEQDPGGHGTFVAGIIAANGGMQGVAPDAKLVSLRVLDEDGFGKLSDVVRAFDWLLTKGQRLNIDVLNISWGAPQATTYHKALLSALVEAAWFSGITVVVASGNDGPTAGSVTAPANDPFVISVGSYDDRGTASTADDVESTFSGRGPTLDGFAKPDTLAPGEHVMSLRVAGVRYLDVNGQPVGSEADRYVHMTGTSAAAAYVAGVAALVKSAHASFRPNDVKGAVAASGRTVAGSTTKAVDAAAALVTTGVANAGLMPSKLLLALLAQSHQLRINGVSWEGVSWDGVSWETISWEAVKWESVTWETVAWEGVSWAEMVVAE